MPDIEMPDPEELGGNVTKPFKFVTGSCLSVVQIGTTDIADCCALAGTQALIPKLPRRSPDGHIQLPLLPPFAALPLLSTSTDLC
jgi:hypothetical protein